MSEFAPAVDVVLEHEGGYVCDPADPGGETKFGISKREYPDLDIANLKREDAAAIYKRDYWDNHRYADIESQAVANKLFDFAVNMGTHQAHKIFQRALCDCGAIVTVDGVLGPRTIVAANSIGADELLASMKGRAADFYQALVAEKPSNVRFLNGWLKRAYA